ncbi:anti-phage deoxyguanosine triphosphatase [Legionella sp. CNM-4043-24]|uniref:anti-phage deoxyguanosine triphosphatase n=1 Tax=Legionella sp. CNM-4043-24 TaxID=3421646 RepID=UPI00403B2382
MDKWTDKWIDRIYYDRRRYSSDRCNYSRDRARIIHSSAFRRLQGKTQIFGLGESDFYRTRLTHSMEVAQISSGIVDKLKKTTKKFKDILPSQNLIEAIGLAHDIGHPPFGHGGEKALNYCLEKHETSFEGNAQTFRICTTLGEHSAENGFNLTRRTLLGLIKYPLSLEQARNPLKYDKTTSPLCIKSFDPPKCIYEHDRNFCWVIDPFSPRDRKTFCEPKKTNETNEHKKALYKSFDCSIMELADDISYGIHDLEDAIALKFIDKDIWQKEVIEKIKGSDTDFQKNCYNPSIVEDLFSDSSFKRKRVISDFIFYFISNVQIVQQSIFESELLDLKAQFPDYVKDELKIMMDLVRKHVIKNKNVQMLEYSGEQLIIKLFDAISSDPARMLPNDFYNKYLEDKNIRVISDYISGMTDAHAVRIYHQIFSPDGGSMFTKI